MIALIPLVVLLPLLGAALALVTGRLPRVQATVTVAALTLVLVVSVVLLVAVDTGGGRAVAVGAWEGPWGIVLVVDRLSALMLVVSAAVLLAVLVYTIGQGLADGDDEAPVSIYNPTYLVLAAGVFDAFVAGDIFNLYVGFEILLAASFVLLTLGGTRARIQAGTTYVVVSLVSSLLFLAAIAVLYAATGTLNIAQLAVRVADLPLHVQLLAEVMLLAAFGIKAAVFPLSSWLPDSYPTAPAPVTAVFAGLLTKVGVYAILRVETVLFPDGHLRVPLMVVALLTLVVGVLGALAQTDIKRLLSFTLLSHIGYMIFGIALGTAAGLGFAVYYVIHHIIVQTTLFLATGLVDRVGGSTNLRRIGGLLKASPLIGVLFFVPALNLGGIPPFSGFLGKLGLFVAGVEDGSWLAYVLIAAGALTSLLTLYALMRAWNLAFWRSSAEAAAEAEAADQGASGTATVRAATAGSATARAVTVREGPARVPGDEPRSRRTAPSLMVASTAGMVALSLALTVFAGPLFGVTERTGVEAHRDAYVGLVFPEEAP